MSLHALLEQERQVMAAVVVAFGVATGSHAVATEWQESGRPLPEPRVPGPGLDPDLLPYRSCPVAAGEALTGTAPAILPDLVRRWIEAFKLRVPGVAVDVPPPYGSPQGALNQRLDEFLRGSGDFALLTRAMSDADRATFTAARGHEPVVVPVAGGSFAHFGFVDPVVVVVNDSNPIGQLRTADLRRLLAADEPRSRRPRTWGDLGVAEWPDRPVRIVGGAEWGGEASARGLVIRERLLQGSSLRSDLGPASGTEADVPARVAADPTAIGFTGLGHLVPGIRALPIENAAGKFVAPAFEEVASARYPLARTVDLVLATPPQRPLLPAMAEFVKFVLSRDGQATVREQGVFLPLRAVQATAAADTAGLQQGGCAAASGQ